MDRARHLMTVLLLAAGLALPGVAFAQTNTGGSSSGAAVATGNAGNGSGVGTTNVDTFPNGHGDINGGGHGAWWGLIGLFGLFGLGGVRWRRTTVPVDNRPL